MKYEETISQLEETVKQFYETLKNAEQKITLISELEG